MGWTIEYSYGASRFEILEKDKGEMWTLPSECIFDLMTWIANNRPKIPNAGKVVFPVTCANCGNPIQIHGLGWNVCEKCGKSTEYFIYGRSASDVCEWKKQNGFDHSIYDSTCGKTFFVLDIYITLLENGYKYCPGCGRKILPSVNLQKTEQG